MELRVLRYFLTVAKEQSFTKAAEQLHITQPTLSRQLASLEDELGTTLFNRGGHSVTLTDAGLLLKRRALEIIDLEDKIVDEFTANEGAIEGVITIGCGEFAAVETLAKIIGIFIMQKMVADRFLYVLQDVDIIRKKAKKLSK
ncbi:LysR family transcriptional regulator [uncultured Eubacterium sp.]|uniref:LysR family transcriptional regulator n=1 Tax=uncultured Eubacterium sp. TaxID=165185 RepID=UPI003263E3B2